MIKKSSIEQVIDQADIVEVVGQFLNLKRRGSNYIGLCPFHNEKTPSFNVNPSRGIYKCFGCGKGGDVVSFIEEYEQFSFVEAIRWLANYYQITLEETETPDEAKEQRQEEESLRIINEFAADYFHRMLTEQEEGRIVGRGYFKERGFTGDTIAHFLLGYCLDDWDAFTKKALSKGYDLQLLETAGLVKTRNGKTYDNYKGRVTFPIFSPTGKVLGFGARILKKNDKAPKYLNSPENKLYVKSKILYGLYQARQAIRKADECLLVEGYTDVISLHQGGLENVVASSGTSLTEGQLKLIGNLSKNLTFLYDGDAAGVKAALRGLDMALAQGFRVRLVLLPEGEDPDGFMQANGAKVFLAYMEEHRRDVIDFHLELGLKEAARDPIKKAGLVSEIAETLSHINKAEDFTLQQDYIRRSAEKLNIEEQGLLNLVNKFTRERVQKEQKQEWNKQRQEEQGQQSPEVSAVETEELVMPVDKDAARLLEVEQKKEWHLLQMLLLYGTKPYLEEQTVAQYFFATIDPDILSDPLVKKMTLDYHRYWQKNGHPPEEQFYIKHSDKEVRHKAVDIFYEKYRPNDGWKDKYKIDIPYGEDIYQEEVKSGFAYFELKFIRQLIEENEQQIKEETDEDNLKVLMKTHIELKKKEKTLLSVVIIK